MMAGARQPVPTSLIKQIGWIPPPQSWYKVNTDGSSVADRSSAAGEGIIKDHNGNFVGAWSANLGACTNNVTSLILPKLISSVSLTNWIS